MKQKLKQYGSNFLGQHIVSVYENSVYLSSRLRKDLAIRPGDFLKFFMNKEKSTIGIKLVSVHEKGSSYKVNSGGYCQLTIGRQINKGRYMFQDVDSGIFIFQK